jgi:hypothetical protein
MKPRKREKRGKPRTARPGEKVPRNQYAETSMYPIFSAIFRQNFVFGGDSLFGDENMSECLV